jgi:protein-S-isoprenylcysteine O-methyltransferase Ste14
MWFRFRLAVMAMWFGVSIGMAMWLAEHPAQSPVLASSVDLVGARAVFVLSGALSLVAFAWRVWAESLLGAVVYGQQANHTIVSDGPYAWTRNPLYLGTWLFFGASLAPYLPLLLWLVLWVGFALLLRNIVLDEERAFGDRGGAAWLDYARRVPRFLGARVPSPSATRTLVSPRNVVMAVLSNLFLCTLGLYRVGTAMLPTTARLLGVINGLGLVVWLGVVLVQRARQSSQSTQSPIEGVR